MVNNSSRCPNRSIALERGEAGDSASRCHSDGSPVKLAVPQSIRRFRGTPVRLVQQALYLYAHASIRILFFIRLFRLIGDVIV